MPEREPFYGGPIILSGTTLRERPATCASHDTAISHGTCTVKNWLHLDRVKTGEEIGSLFLLYLFPPFRPLFPIPSRAHRTRFVVQFRCGVSERGEQKFSPGALTLYIRRDDDE